MTKDEYAAFAAAFAVEHREMRHLLQTVRNLLGPQHPWSPEAVEALIALQNHMRHHFSQEEEGGYLEEALAVAPRFSGQANMLLKQHPELLERVDHVVDLARHSGGAPEAWEKLRQEAESLFSALVAHEGGENQIVQQALNSGEETSDE
ncbi:MAG TPA: hemerythrin domain-containing protein [Pirellulales bacterium]|jgi:iron-sulfur cluster repair protein YtfE (RIC family)|nr:hemerythrin domain-containing protein [Pirellulales bacterium]